MLWWEERKQGLSEVKRLFINMGSGPECSGRRSQFIQKMVALSILPVLKFVSYTIRPITASTTVI